MDATAVQEAANALWPLIGTGAAERLGAAGTEGAMRALLGRVRALRRDRGLPEDPATPHELATDLRALAADDAESAEALQVVINHIKGPIVAENVNLGFQQR